MYTVLIQSKKTEDCFRQFYPLFSEFVDDGKLDICSWTETNTTVETALPDLYGLVSHKLTWRAIVVDVEPDDADSRYPTAPGNPFDFLENANRESLEVVDGEIVDCDAPLIRLTHLLGGFPEPEIVYDAVTTPEFDDEGRGTFKVDYVTSNEQQVKVEREALTRYREHSPFDAVPPSEIILIKVRRPSEYEDILRANMAWQAHSELDSSMFWKRNTYPKNCRFLVYDLEGRGIMREQRSFFRLWNAVLLLSLNDTDPDALQAYRLYRLGIKFDHDALSSSLQQTVNKLNFAKYYLKKSIAKDEKIMAEEGNPLPSYTIEVPVTFNDERVPVLVFDNDSLRLTGGVESSDAAVWSAFVDEAKTEVEAQSKRVDRGLDYAAGRLRGTCTYPEYEVLPLTDYQKEDVTTSLEGTYQSILDDQRALPNGLTSIQEELDEADDTVRETMRTRVSGRDAAAIAAICLTALIASAIPAFFTKRVNIASPIISTLAGILIVAIVLLAVLWTQRKKLLDLVDDFQSLLRDAQSELSQNASIFSMFLGDLASHIHGKSYLDILETKREEKDDAFFLKRKHLSYIEDFLSKISLWSTALQTTIDIESTDAFEDFDEFSDSISYESLYSFDAGKGFSVPLNRSGMTVESPYSFVSRLTIDREELYEMDEAHDDI